MAKYKAKAVVTEGDKLKLSKLFEKIDYLYSTHNDEQRRIINESTKSPVGELQRFFDSINKLDDFRVQQSIATLDSIAKEGSTTTLNVISAWNNVHKQVRGKNQLGHGEWSIISIRCQVIYMGLLMMRDDVRLINSIEIKTDDDGNLIKHGADMSALKIIDIDKYYTTKKGKKRHSWDEKQLTKAAEAARQLFIIAKVISSIDAPLVHPMQDLKELVRDYLNPNNQETHTLMKETGVEVAAGIADLDLKVETTQLNSKVKAPLELKIGKSLNLTMDRTQDHLLKYFDDLPWGDLVGSKSVGDEVVKQLSDLAVGKIPKPSRSTTILKKKGSTKGIKTPHIKKLLNMKVELKEIKPLPKVISLEKEPTDPQLRYRIQQGLRKRLQQHMHRPALIYRTGRFAKSVKLLTLSENAKGELYGKYTYRLDPYQTFEDTSKWPSGFNPKPLITKVIRELAEEKAKKRIAYLRRT